MEVDVAVIGGGMAGTIAALRAAELGADVALIRKGHGASAMSSGTIDIAGPARFLPRDAWDTLPAITDILKDILRTKPLHPYSIVAGGRDGVDHLCSRLRQACGFMLEKIPSLGLQGSCERNLALPNVFGTVKFSAFAPRSLIGGDLVGMRDAHVLLVGINGLAIFRPRICRQALERYSSQHQPHAVAKISAVEADIPRFPDGFRSAPFEMAQCFDNPEVVEEFAETLNKEIESSVTHIGFPPVLGLNNHAEAYEIFCRELQPKVFELISPNFSVPGYRLQLSLDAALRESAVRVVTAEVIGAERDGRLVQNLLLGDMKAKRTVTAGKYVVAKGKFSSGGLVATNYANEPTFGLPLFSDNKRVDGSVIQDLLNWNTDETQLFLSCGVHIDGLLRPLDEFGEPVYENLFAAGSIIGEYDYLAEKCGFGVTVLTGYIAGEKATA